MDGALLEYGRRRAALEDILREAAAGITELTVQAKRHAKAMEAAQLHAEQARNDTEARGALRKKLAHQKRANDLAGQIQEQRKEIAPIKERLAHVKSTLTRLRAQRDLLLSRLKAADW